MNNEKQDIDLNGALPLEEERHEGNSLQWANGVRDPYEIDLI